MVNRVLFFGLSLLLLAACARAGEAPKVAETFPATGAAEVDPGLHEIRVVFDAPMQTGSTLREHEKGFPDFLGAVWRGDRTIVMWVRLGPARTYQISLNTPRRKGFRSREGVPLEPVIWEFATTGDGTAQGAPVSQQELNRWSWEQFRYFIDNYYSYRDHHKIDWEKTYAEFETRMLEAADTVAWAENAARLLSAANDLHNSVRYDGRYFRAASRAVPGNWNDRAIRRAVPDVRMVNKTFALGRTPDGIGYISINSVSRSDAADFDGFADMMKSMMDTHAIIIDLRANSGGSEPLGLKVAGWFTREKVLYAKHAYRDPNAEGGFGAPRERWLAPAGEGSFYAKPVFALSGRKNMSSADAFVLMFKACPAATVVGAATYGSSGNPKMHNLANGVTLGLASWKAMRPDGTVFEGEGIQPDVLVDPPQSAFRSTDPVLAKALELAREAPRLETGDGKQGQ